MFKDYIIQIGDTAEIIARKELGDPAKQSEIIAVNNLSGTLTAGQSIKIPTKSKQNITDDIRFQTTGLLKSLSLNIAGNSLELFDNFQYVESLNGIRAGGFSCAYNPLNLEHVRSFKFGNNISILANGGKLATGYTMTPAPYYEQGSAGIVMHYKSATHILIRSDIAPNNFPLEFAAGQTLAQITQSITSKFNIKITIDNDISNIIFDDGDEGGASSDIQDNVYSFLVYLCRSRGLIIRDDAEGGLVISKIKKTLPVAQFISNETNGLYGIKTQYNYEQVAKTYSIYSQYGGNNIFGSYTNELFPLNIYKNISANNVSQGLAQEIAKWLMLRDIASAVKIVIPVNDWYTPELMRYKAGQIIQVQAPEVGIYERKDFIIENVNLFFGEKKYGGFLTCTLPECYTGKNLEWLPMI